MHDMKERYSKGETLIGCFISELASPNVLRILKVAGVRFAIVDCEHGPFDFSQVAAFAAVANGLCFPLLVRMPGIIREHAQKYLDAGADGLLFPMISTVESATHAVGLAKYPPLGMRGASAMRPHAEYDPGKLAAYMKRADERTMVFIQIETREGVRNAAQIAEVPGLDGLFVGPNDLSIDLGTPGDTGSPGIRDAVDTVVRAAEAAGKPSGIITSKTDFIEWCRGRGMRLLSCNSEVGFMLQGASQMVKAVGGT